jgi:hypothetical protein
MRTTLVVCESPWTRKNGQLEPWSMRPFVEGIAELYHARLVYRTFTSGDELANLLSYEAIDRPTDRVVVYIASHGRGSRLAPSRDPTQMCNLSPLARRLRRGVESVWVGACDVGGSQALEDFLSAGGAVWAGGYICGAYWDASLLLDLAVLQQVLRSGPIKTRARVVQILRWALRGFDPEWVVGDDTNGQAVCLRRAVRVVARDRVQGVRPRDVSTELQSALRWDLVRKKVGAIR